MLKGSGKKYNIDKFQVSDLSKSSELWKWELVEYKEIEMHHPIKETDVWSYTTKVLGTTVMSEVNWLDEQRNWYLDIISIELFEKLP